MLPSHRITPHKMRVALTALVVTLACPALKAREGHTNTQREADIAAISVVSAAGKTRLLSHLGVGQPVVIVVMRGAWCKACVTQLKRLKLQNARLKKLGAKVVGLVAHGNGDDLRKLSAMRLGVEIVAVKAADLKLLGMSLPHRNYAFPGLLFLDRCGRIADQRLGRSPDRPQDPFIFERLRDLASQPLRCGILI